MRFAKHFTKQGRSFRLFHCFSERAVEGTEGCKRDRDLWREQRAIRGGQRAEEETEGRREDRGPER